MNNSEKLKSYKMNKKKKNISKLRENIETIISAIFIALLIRIFVIEAYKIPSGSMVPTLIEGDYLLVNKFIYGVRIPIFSWKLPAFSDPKRGDIVVFHYPRYSPRHWTIELFDLITFSIFGLTNTEDSPKNFIKRLLGLPGDVISFLDKKVVVNGNILPTSNKIDKDFWNLIKSISNPEKYSNPSSQQLFYSYDKGIVKSTDSNFNVFIETLGDKKHLIQLENDSYYNVQPDIEYLYIPKKGDTLEIVLRDIEGEQKLFFSVNEELKFITNFEDTFSSEHLSLNYNKNTNNDFAIQDNDYLFSFYYNILPANTPTILREKKVFKHTFDSNYYFMVGDNRDRSSDSRKWGLVHQNLIIGKPIIIYYPLKRFANIPE